MTVARVGAGAWFMNPMRRVKAYFCDPPRQGERGQRRATETSPSAVWGKNKQASYEGRDRYRREIALHAGRSERASAR